MNDSAEQSAIYASSAVSGFKQAFSDEAAKVLKSLGRMQAMLIQSVGEDHVTNDLVRVFDHSRNVHDVVDESRKRLNEQIAKLGGDTIPKRFQTEGIKTVNIVDVGRVTVSYRASASMPDKEKGFEWLRDNEHGDIIVETVNAQTLAAFVREEFVDKNMEPPDVFKFSTSPYTSITKAK